MLNIDVLTIGNKFKNDAGAEYKVTSNFSQTEDKIFIELDKIESENEIDNTIN